MSVRTSLRAATRALAALLPLALAAPAGAEDAAAPAGTPAEAKAPATIESGGSLPPPSRTGEGAIPVSPVAPAQTEPEGKGFSLLGGWGYYEAFHLGAAYHFTDRAAAQAFVGYSGVTGDTNTNSFGAGFWHAIGGPLWGMQAGWDLKALYWKQADPNYFWKMISLVGGGYLSRPLGGGLEARLDAGVALTVASQSDRKQNENFGHPQRWNGSVCVDLVYRLGR